MTHDASTSPAPAGEAPDMGLAATTAFLESRRDELTDALAMTPYVNYAAPSNMPTDCDIWSPDWRDQLAAEDPYREAGPPRATHGSKDVAEALGVVHDAILRSISQA